MMKRLIVGLIVVVATVGLGLGLGAPDAAATGCPPDSVRSGTGCIDKYEASVWDLSLVSPPFKKALLISKIKAGTATEAGLLAAGAVQLGLAVGDLATAGCPNTGNGCVDFYAVSIPGVKPSAQITWFQAAAASRNSWKRLPTNAEWQAAALGTPDPGSSTAGSEDCNTNDGGGVGSDAVVDTGSRANCKSDVGAFDMVGNLSEWVADWVPLSTACPGWLLDGFEGVVDDLMCLAGADAAFGPGALLRGGDYDNNTGAGVFAVETRSPSRFDTDFGFRAAR